MGTRCRTLLLASLLLASPAFAIWTPMGQPVPVDRALTNLQSQLHDHPDDASIWLAIARLHSYAFFTASDQIPMRNNQPFISHIPGKPRPTEPSAADLTHLKDSILAFHKSIALDSTQPLPYLGLGWDLEQGARFADRIGKIPGEETTQWQARALDNYRQAYQRAYKRESEMKFFPPSFEAISMEAAERIIAIQQGNPDPAAQAEVAKMKDTIANPHVPRAVTPVIFAFREDVPLRDLLAPDLHVAFDLDGLGAAPWSWLQVLHRHSGLGPHAHRQHYVRPSIIRQRHLVDVLARRIPGSLRAR